MPRPGKLAALGGRGSLFKVDDLAGHCGAAIFQGSNGVGVSFSFIPPI